MVWCNFFYRTGHYHCNNMSQKSNLYQQKVNIQDINCQCCCVQYFFFQSYRFSAWICGTAWYGGFSNIQRYQISSEVSRIKLFSVQIACFNSISVEKRYSNSEFIIYGLIHDGRCVSHFFVITEKCPSNYFQKGPNVHKKSYFGLIGPN